MRGIIAEATFMSESAITHVSDTALMTAACRAIETARSDGWIRDPLAARLAGDRGMAIARGLPNLEVMCFGVGMRSRILDTLLTGDIPARGIATVLCAGAGLDTRPWRLGLPPSLRWVEADLAPMLAYKTEILAGETPRCRFESTVCDVNEASHRRELFSRASQGPALLITEGLLMYLARSTVESIASEAAASGIRYWLTDLSTRAMSAATNIQSCEQIQGVRAQGHLSGEEILEVAGRAGWRIAASHTYALTWAKLIPPGRMESVIRGRAEMEAKGIQLPPPPPPTDLSGVHLFERGDQ